MAMAAPVSMIVLPLPLIVPAVQIDPSPVSVRSAEPLTMPLLRLILSTVTLLSTDALPLVIDALSVVCGSALNVQLAGVFHDPVEPPHVTIVCPNVKGREKHKEAMATNQCFLRWKQVRGAPFIDAL